MSISCLTCLGGIQVSLRGSCVVARCNFNSDSEGATYLSRRKASVAKEWTGSDANSGLEIEKVPHAESRVPIDPRDYSGHGGWHSKDGSGRYLPCQESHHSSGEHLRQGCERCR